MKDLALGVVCIMALTAVVFGGKYLISVQKYKEVIKEIQIDNVDLSKISDGTYTGSSDAIYVGANVSVTVKDNKIVEIILLNHNTGRGTSAEVIPEKVIKAQSLQVDTISGATNSSKVILKSIENALKSDKS